MKSFLYHRSKLINFIFRKQANCSPSESDEHGVITWDPTSSATESPEPDSGGICLYLDISTIHITSRDRAILLQMDQGSWLTSIQHDFGTIVIIPEEINIAQVENADFSKYFHLVFNYAVNSGCRLINFDTDGTRLDDLFSKF